jgi:hypothetical protein
MTVTIDITEDTLITQLRAWLLTLLPAGVEVRRSQQNGVPMPAGAFVAITTIVMPKLATNVSSWAPGASNPGQENNQTSTRWDVQMDFYGSGASQNSVIVANLVRTSSASSYFEGAGGLLAPLYAGDPRNNAMINGEQQYEARWTVEASFQFNPTITTSLDFAASLAVQLKEVDTTFPPGA